MFSAASGAALPALAACPAVADAPASAFPAQLEIEEAAAAGLALTFTENPLFAADVAAGKLPPVKDRLPEQPLIELPYETCGTYGGTIEGTSRSAESGTADILSWRQVALVQIADDLVTIVPNVARSWKWNDDYTAITFELRRGHKWSDGSPFGPDDVVFYFDDIVNNKDISPEPTREWGVNARAKKIDDTHVEISFDAPFPGLLTYMATSGSYFTPFAPRHYFEKLHGAYNANADAEAKAAGYENWTKRFDDVWDKWMDAQTLTATGLEIPTLESHVLELEPTTEQRLFKANPYYFKVDSSGQQLPYIDRVHERFLNADLQLLAILNGEIDFKAQGTSLQNYPTMQESTEKSGYEILMPAGASGPILAFNITHKDPKLRAIYSDLRFRQAISHAINREEINQVSYFDLGTPTQALPPALSFSKPEDSKYMIEFDLDKANALLDEMGMKKGADGVRTFPDGSPFTILWEYSSQFAAPEFVKLMSDYFKSVGLNVNTKEQTSEATRENAKSAISDINTEWDIPYEPTLIADVNLYTPYYSEISPLFGVGWRQWANSKGAEGEEPPAWAKEMYTLADEWRTVLPGTPRYAEIGRRLIDLNLENMTIIGTVGNIPKPIIVKGQLHNVKHDMPVVHFNYGYIYPYRPEQWFRAK
ncbi:MAG TPA: ABC transporter substrate-binding protein [Devosia sp.]|nr:ABC transporter substrate-binding protein [Devosia sp.]